MERQALKCSETRTKSHDPFLIQQSSILTSVWNPSILQSRTPISIQNLHVNQNLHFSPDSPLQSRYTLHSVLIPHFSPVLNPNFSLESLLQSRTPNSAPTPILTS